MDALRRRDYGRPIAEGLWLSARSVVALGALPAIAAAPREAVEPAAEAWSSRGAGDPPPPPPSWPPLPPRPPLLTPPMGLTPAAGWSQRRMATQASRRRPAAGGAPADAASAHGNRVVEAPVEDGLAPDGAAPARLGGAGAGGAGSTRLNRAVVDSAGWRGGGGKRAELCGGDVASALDMIPHGPLLDAALPAALRCPHYAVYQYTLLRLPHGGGSCGVPLTVAVALAGWCAARRDGWRWTPPTRPRCGGGRRSERQRALAAGTPRLRLPREVIAMGVVAVVLAAVVVVIWVMLAAVAAAGLRHRPFSTSSRRGWCPPPRARRRSRRARRSTSAGTLSRWLCGGGTEPPCSAPQPPPESGGGGCTRRGRPPLPESEALPAAGGGAAGCSLPPALATGCRIDTHTRRRPPAPPPTPPPSHHGGTRAVGLEEPTTEDQEIETRRWCEPLFVERAAPPLHTPDIDRESVSFPRPSTSSSRATMATAQRNARAAQLKGTPWMQESGMRRSRAMIRRHTCARTSTCMHEHVAILDS